MDTDASAMACPYVWGLIQHALHCGLEPQRPARIQIRHVPQLEKGIERLRIPRME